ncbi:MAG: NAD(P)H-hydrate dehydratase [Actinomycetota bacterium]
MRPLLSPEQMRRADQRCIAAGTPAVELMDRAGRAVARSATALSGRRYGARIVVVCGKGNNGGDGFVAARALAAEGAAVRCLLVCSEDEIAGPARSHLERARSSGVPVAAFDEAVVASFEPHLAIDAIFGTGFSGRAEGAAARAIETFRRIPLVVSVDIPSGVDGSTGACTGEATRADVTVAIAAEKWGTAHPPGSLHAGAVEVVDVGIAIDLRDVESWMVEAGDVARMLPRRAPDAHKRSAGSVAVIAGSDAMPGAATLTGMGAIRMGGGYVTLGTTPRARAVATGVLPEMLCPEITDDPQLGAAALDDFKDVLARAGAIAVGPGVGRGAGPRAIMRRLLEEVPVPLVLDADALNSLEGDLGPVERRDEPTILTPHPGEMASLLGVSAGAVNSDRIGAARAAASRAGSAVVLLKGYRTVIAAAGGKQTYVIQAGGPELATAGSGDVLTGAIAALCAAGVDPLGAALAGAHVHGIAGALAGDRVGAAGVMARDVADELGRAVDLITESYAVTP